LKGEASPEISELYEAVVAAQDAGLAAIRAGVTGKEVHARVCRAFQERGFPEREGRGFTHSTGHGVGLEVHEKPSLSEVGETLEAGHVVTVEPGLYYPEIGGVRLEDMVAVIDSGYENFTHFERKLVL
jgi:Xaa-Pro aminopeptidase